MEGFLAASNHKYSTDQSSQPAKHFYIRNTNASKQKNMADDTDPHHLQLEPETVTSD